jgi:hypothetical protein
MSALDTNWFIADESDASEIAAVILNDAGELDTWPNLRLNLGEMELRALWAAVGGWDLSASKPVASDLLFEAPDGELLVIKVAPSFLAALASLPPDRFTGVAGSWANSEFAGGHSMAELVEVISEIRSFATNAATSRKSVLQLATL